MLAASNRDRFDQKTLDSRTLLLQEHQEIQQRLDRYCDFFSDIAEETIAPSDPVIDIFKELALLQDCLQNQNVDLCFCERENVCRCNNCDECVCDGEEYYTVSEVDVIEGSNSNMIFEFSMLSAVTISRLKNVRFFTLDKETDNEMWIMDLVKTIEKRKKKKVVSKYFLKTKSWCTGDGYIHYEIFDVPHLRGKRIQIKIDYLQYHKTDA
uniref:Uncharacterized protein n=1 Tax=Pithovirus LCPAC304 TaxID=2506594 RepID=A0A481Z8I7_9VIRU|nr:MAG: hypothetical protein LCPAC304_04440 [Pithovirus LCPAC304]